MANRIIPEHRRHERAFLPLSAPAKLCWVLATTELGASGIGALHPATLAPLTSLPLDQVDAGLAELEQTGWLRRDGAVMWLVGNLLEQGLNPNNPKHRASVRSHLAALEPIAPEIVAAFREHYATWLQPKRQGSGEASPSQPDSNADPFESDPDGIGMVSEYQSDGNGIPTGSRRKGGREEGRKGGTATATSASPAGAQARDELVAVLPPDYHADLDELLERVPADGQPAWLRSLHGFTTGLHPLGGGLPNAVPAAALGEALRQFVANGESNRGRFAGYLRRVVRPPEASTGGGGGGPGRRGRPTVPQQYEYAPTATDEEPKWDR